MYVYYPNSVFLPQGSSVERNSSATKRSDGTVVEYDTRTVFFDLFFNANTRCLQGIGPSLLNLKDELLPLQLMVDDRCIDFRLQDNRALIFLESQALEENKGNKIQVTLRFKTFERTMTIECGQNVCGWQFTDEEPRVSMSTLQKNNRLIWIKDWILWHSRLYGVKRVILYDNGSDDQEGLSRMLRTVEPEVEVILVHWPFPYGKAPYKFTHTGQLNHCRMMLLSEQHVLTRLNYCINLDIDEYLVVPSGQGLVDYLDSKLDSPFISAVNLKEMQVPNILPDGCSWSSARCFDYKYRFRRFGNNPTSNPAFDSHHMAVNRHLGKYIYRVDSNLFNATHTITKLSRKPTKSDFIGFFCHNLKKKIKRRMFSLKHKLRFRDVGGPY